MQEVSGIELDTAVMLENDEFVFNWARAWDSQTGAIDATVIPQARDKVTTFYRHFFLCNFAHHEADRLRALRDAANAWIEIYQDLETVCKNHLLHVTAAPNLNDLDLHLKTVFGGNKGPLLAEIRADWVRLLLEYMHACSPELTLQDIDDMKGTRRAVVEVVRTFRNDMGHEGDPRKSNALYILGMPIEDRKRKAQQVTEATRVVLELLNAIRAHKTD
jgi:hypothetical protein